MDLAPFSDTGTICTPMTTPATHATGPAASWQAKLPNTLTMARVVLAVVFFGVLCLGEYRPIAAGAAWSVRSGAAFGQNVFLLIGAVLFIAAAATDALDGHLARRWKVVSRFGRVMDPFADKLLVLGAFVMLAAPMFRVFAPGDPHTSFQATRVASWMVIVILGRELLVTSLRGVMEADGVDFSATLSGKLKMILQSAVVPAVLVMLAFATPWVGTPTRVLLDVLVWGTVIVTAASGVPYVRRAVRRSGALK